MRRAVSYGSVILALIVLHLGAAAAQTLPAGVGGNEFKRVCGECHALSVVTAMRLPGSQWEATVDRMSTLGAKMTEREARLIANYLAANFSPETGAANPGTGRDVVESSERAPTKLSMDSSLLESNGCLACHSVQGQGGYTAPDLAELGDRRTPEEIKAALVSPDEKVLPENRHIRVVTNQGQTITGKLLNQDAFSIQLIDAKGQLHSFRRASLRESTILVKGLMPSYQGKLTADQIGNLVRLVSALNEAP